MISPSTSRRTGRAPASRPSLPPGPSARRLLYKRALDEIGMVTSEVIISAPDDREGYDEVGDESREEVVRFWKKMMERYGDEKTYNRSIVASFKDREDPEILIVVDKLLTGFDAPKEHRSLSRQAAQGARPLAGHRAREPRRGREGIRLHHRLCGRAWANWTPRSRPIRPSRSSRPRMFRASSPRTWKKSKSFRSAIISFGTSSRNCPTSSTRKASSGT